ncbi:MAG: hypothetical protein AAGG75_00295 [Bacteroidota bacterium]
MKFYSISFSFLVVLFGLSTMNWNTAPDSVDAKNTYADLVDERTQAQYLFTTSSESLTTKLHQFLPRIFDRVDQIDLHYGTDEGYYYAVYGEKNCEKVVQTVLTTEARGLNQDFPSLAELGLKESDFFVYCYWKISRITPTGAVKLECQLDRTNLPICGRSVTGITCFPLRPGEEIPVDPIEIRE